eukprot:INCI7698.7.p1 GENE.INCI7698.7~~INCI7698.7.p1  ORF type:complete len:788 (+),score=120.69 INCI7698.7:588-2951(+)
MDARPVTKQANTSDETKEARPRPQLSVSYPARTSPGKARIAVDGGIVTLLNDVLTVSFSVAESMALTRVEHLEQSCRDDMCDPSHVAVDVSQGGFTLQMLTGDICGASHFVASNRLPQIQPLPADLHNPNLGKQFHGQKVHVTLQGRENSCAMGITVNWAAELRDESNYFHVSVEVVQPSETSHKQTVAELWMLDATVDAAVTGHFVPVPAWAARTVHWPNKIPPKGPAALESARISKQKPAFDGGLAALSETIFAAVEHPLADNTVEATKSIGQNGTRAWTVRCGRRALSAERSGLDSIVVSETLVIGVAPTKMQMRRAFLYYIERARAHPSRMNVHYNTWYDLAAGSLFSERDMVSTVRQFVKELATKRGVQLDSFLADDGWDNRSHGLWNFHNAWPNGFRNVVSAAREAGGSLGVWLSPWGGYGGRDSRVAAAKEAGMETVGEGERETLVFSGKKYFARFRQIVLQLMQEYGVSLFKFDGIGSLSSQRGDPSFIKDFSSMINLLAELRGLHSKLWINLSTGTWPSAFWLQHADCVWRRGHDHFFAEGEPPSAKEVLLFGRRNPPRERWITYRDAQTFSNVVRAAPLFPLSSLMTHGVIFAKNAWDLNMPLQGQHFINEVRSAFGSGTMLQELYITPSFLTSSQWDALAESILWARSQMSTLVDSHWVGGDPAKGDVYGWAAWRWNEAQCVVASGKCNRAHLQPSTQSCALTIRNPSEHAAQFEIEPVALFDLPPHAAVPSSELLLASPYKDQRLRELRLEVSQTATISLASFEVLTFECVPSLR